MTREADVAVSRGDPTYPVDPPYSPSDCIPEYPFMETARVTNVNHAYRAVRAALRLLGLDASNFGAPQWNPLGGIIAPGDVVVLKPNFVRDFRESRRGTGDCLITHGSVVRAVLDYVFIALRGRGRIIVADAPQNDADFDAIRRIAGLTEIQRFYADRAGVDVEIYDLRPERADKIDGVIVGHTPLPGDPAGYARVNLGQDSAFADIGSLCHLLYGAEYDTGELRRHHTARIHEYLISKTVLGADVVISLPKLKTHKKVGLTVNLKNMVGINGNKNWLPHYREGTPPEGGDQFPSDGLRSRVERAALASFKRWFPLLGALRPRIARPVKDLGRWVFGDTDRGATRSGNWYGNDTSWRMVLDLNRILLHADREGQMRDRPVRKFFSVVDGIVSGEGNGPLDPTPKAVGIVLAGTNPEAVDLACARLMGFDYRRIPMLHRALSEHHFPLRDFKFQDVTGRSDDRQFDRPLTDLQGPVLAFRPHFGWKGHIEVSEPLTTGELAKPCAE